MSVAWESYTELGNMMPKQEVVKKSPNLTTEGVADTGSTVLCGGLDTMRKLQVPQSVLFTSSLKTGGPSLSLGPFLWMSWSGAAGTTSPHSERAVSPVHQQDLPAGAPHHHFISDNFPLPVKQDEAVDNICSKSSRPVGQGARLGLGS